MVAALAQHQTANNFGTTCVATFSPATTSGRLLTLAIQDQQTTDITGVADSAGNTWIKGPSIVAGGIAQKHIEIWYAPNANSCTTVTATMGASSANANMSIQEWSGTGSWNLRNSNSLANASTTNPTSCTATCQSGDVILSGLAYLEAVSGTRQDTLTTGTLIDTNARGTTAFSSAYRITASSTSDGCAWTMSPAVSSAVATASFGPTGGTPPPVTLIPAFRAAATASNNSTTPSIVVPATCQTGDVLVILLSENNTTAWTSDPAGLTSLDVNTSVSTFPVRAYRAVVGTGGITAGGTITWGTLSAIRAWDLALVAYANVSNSSPIMNMVGAGGTTTVCTTPSLNVTGTGFVLEGAMCKSNPGPITAWTAPAGYTTKAQSAAFQTFAGSGFLGEKNTNMVTGTVGGDTWSADQPFNDAVRYTLALNPATAPVSGTGAVFRLGAAASANDLNPSILVPSSCQNGDVILVQLNLNDTNTVTGVPSGITQLNADTSIAAFPNWLYWGVVGVGGLIAGATLQWSLSTIRSWSLNLVAYSGADTVHAPVFTEAALVGTTLSTPSLTTTTTTLLLECGAGKSNPGPILNWTAPSGWNIRSQSDAYQGFAGSAFFAEKAGGTSAAGTYGGDTYTADQPFNNAVKYTIGLAAGTGVVPPTANAGPDQTVDPWSVVTLTGAASADPDGTVTTYAWTQTAGTTVTLSSTSAVSPTFTAPGSLTAQVLTFSLVVTDNTGLTSTADTVDITVYPATEAYAHAGAWNPLQPLRASGGAWA